jgi:predicted ATPase
VQANMFGASARMLRSPSDENIDACRTAIDVRSRAGMVLLHSNMCSVHAQGLLAAGRVSEAEAALKEGFCFAEQNGEGVYLADLHRVEGLIALAQPTPDRTRADACFSKAIEIAHDQGALPAELRAATDLARLWRAAGSANDPRALLEPILAAFEGGERSSYVREARAWLAEFA